MGFIIRIFHDAGSHERKLAFQKQRLNINAQDKLSYKLNIFQLT